MIICSMRSATSSCRHRSRSAEQRWPAERKADAITSSVTCSGSAVASTIIGLRPPVSAISGTIGPGLAASARLIACPTSTEPVKATPATRGSATSAAPTLPSPGTKCSAVAGTPALCKSPTARAAISGVCSAGFATTVLPAASAAMTWPRKIASGKFHGLMARKAPRPRRWSSFVSPVGPGIGSGLKQPARLGGVVAGIVGGLAHFADGVIYGLAALGLAGARSARRGRPRSDRPRAPAPRRGE